MSTPILIYLDPSELPDYGIAETALRGVPVERQRKAILASCRRFDSYLRGQVIFPLTQAGADVKEAVAIMTAYSMIAVRGMSAESGADEILLTRYEQTIAWLERIADGKAFPDVTDSSSGGTEGRTSGGPAVVSNAQQGFSTRGTNRRNGPFQNS